MLKYAMTLAFATVTIQAAVAGAADEQKSLMQCEGGKCVILTVKPHAAAQPHCPKAEAPEVLQTLEKIIKAYSGGDLKTYAGLLDDDCTYFDQAKSKMITGRQNVIEHLKESIAKHAPNGSEPLLSYTIDQPYIKVTGKMAVVTYRAFQEIGGANPHKAQGMITKVFIKEGDSWKQENDQSLWRVADAHAAAKPAKTQP